jgi:TolC family type I secretion outer membrane protein
MTRTSLIARGLLAAALGLGAAIAAAPASAQSLEEALAKAYQTNPTLAAQRARLRAVDESVPQALSSYRPTARLTGSITRNAGTARAGGQDIGSQSTPKQVGVTVTQSLYDPSAAPGVARADSLVQAQRATLLATEQSVLLSAATAYLDVVQYQSVLALNTNNEQVLKRQLDASRDRFRVGEYTRTDVALSESRVAGAAAARIQSEGTLRAAKATFERYVGIKPAELKSPKPKFKLPGTLDEVVSLAQSNNPNVIAASFNENAQRHAVDQAFGEMLPSASLQASATRTYDAVQASSKIDHNDSLAITGQVVIPLYSAGLPEARVREAKQTANQYRIQITDTRNQITESAISAWQSLQTAKAAVESYKAQIEAARIALEGVRQQAQVGSSTILDVLDREQELLSARVSLVQAERNQLVASFTILSAVGQLTAQQLGLKADYYDPEANYVKTRGKWVGTGVEE